MRLKGSVSAEFRVEMLNALNAPYFNTASTAGIPLGMTTPDTGAAAIGPTEPMLTGTPVSNASAGTSVDSFRMMALLGDNQARIIQVVWRVRW